MAITSISWFILLLMAELAILASSGTAVLDAMAMLLIGYAAILVRTGKHHPTVPNGLSPSAQFLHLEWGGMKTVKLGGLLIVLLSALMLLPFSWEMVIELMLGMLAIELISMLILECSLRFRVLGNLAMLAALILSFWSIHICSNEIASFLVDEKVPGLWATSWTTVFDHWTYTAAILFGSIVAILTLLWWRPERSERLTRPRLWLFT